MNKGPARSGGQSLLDRAGQLYSNPRALAYGALLIAAYLGLEWLSDIREYNGLPVTAWNPGLGIVVAVMLHRPLAGALLLCVGMVLAEVLVVHSVLGVGMIGLLGLLSATSYALATRIARSAVLGLDVSLVRLRDIAVLLLTGALGALVNATLLSLLLIVAGSLTWSDLRESTLPLFVGDVIGIAVITPLCLRLIAHEPGVQTIFSVRPRAGLTVAGVGVLMGGLLWFILDPADPAALTHLYVLILPLIGLALWWGFDGACIGLALCQAFLVLIMHAHGYGQDAFITAQAVMAVLGAAGLLCGAVVSERDAASLAARAAQARLAESEATALRADRFHLVTGMTSALSHEITQPITAARSLARATQLRMDAGGALDLPRLRENMRGIVQQIDLAAEILSRMRAFISRGGPERVPAAIDAIITDTLALIGPRATGHHVAIGVDIAPDLPGIACDRIQIQQVLMNLIGNAIDAIMEANLEAGRAVRRRLGGHIMIGVAKADVPGRITIRVQDDGPGIPADLAPRVFDALTTDKPAGLGLGLSICALIVEAHGGRIWLEKPGPGGTEFRFWLPALPEQAEAEQADAEQADSGQANAR